MSKAKVLVTCRWPEAAEQAMLNAFDADIIGLNKERSEEPFAHYLTQYDYICPTITDPISSEVLRGGGFRTKAFCNFGAGVNHIDLKACKDAGVIVTNTPDVLTEDTADIAILLALMAARRAGEGERLVRAQGWPGWSPTSMLGMCLTGKTLGLVGFGRIGQAMALKAHHAFGMKIIYYSRTPTGEDEFPFPVKYRPLDVLIRESDVISLHAPGGPATKHLINAERIAEMKQSAIVVNTARGDLIDEDALIAALKSRTIAAAGLDVFEGEPHLRPAWLELENAVLLPHLGSATQETRTAMGLRSLANLQAIVAGQEPPDRVA
tara:strand:+ start:1332 stop:2297 length:966 start_codon:yes stop_codon:yes gene_type:complete